MNRFENCQVLWGKRYRGKETGLIRHAEAVLQTKEGKLYFVSAEFISINSTEYKYLNKLLLDERGSGE